MIYVLCVVSQIMFGGEVVSETTEVERYSTQAECDAGMALWERLALRSDVSLVCLKQGDE